ncbi:hypothetical protein ACVW1C_004317 [Bradyrhizobium sp. USDA 4011]
MDCFVVIAPRNDGLNSVILRMIEQADKLPYDFNAASALRVPTLLVSGGAAGWLGEAASGIQDPLILGIICR